MSHPIDIYVGNRVRQRRRLLGMTMHALAEAVNIRFQQVQKYESGANRISASRLWELSIALKVPVAYFFDGIETHLADERALAQNGNHAGTPPEDPFASDETIALVRAFYTLNDVPRQRLLDLAKAMSGES